MMKIIHTFVILAYKESDDLEDCIKSVLKQSVKSNVVIATSTPNDFITDLAGFPAKVSPYLHSQADGSFPNRDLIDRSGHFSRV